MNQLKLKACITFATALLFFQTALWAQVILPARHDTEAILSLNSLWKFKYIAGAETGADLAFYQPGFNTGSWANIKVPGNWEMQGFAEASYGKKLKTVPVYTALPLMYLSPGKITPFIFALTV